MTEKGQPAPKNNRYRGNGYDASIIEVIDGVQAGRTYTLYFAGFVAKFVLLRNPD
jgi:hypothetical protein